MQALGLRRNVQVRDTKLVRQVCGAWGVRAAGAWGRPGNRVSPDRSRVRGRTLVASPRPPDCTPLAATQSALSATGCLNRAVRFQFLGRFVPTPPPVLTSLTDCASRQAYYTLLRPTPPHKIPFRSRALRHRRLAMHARSPLVASSGGGRSPLRALALSRA
jgi:hypothetical protein